MTHATLAVNHQGRVTLPVGLRRELGIEPGSSVVAYVEDGRLIMEDRARLVARVQREAAVGRTSGESPVEALIADRRAEARDELAG